MKITHKKEIFGGLDGIFLKAFNVSHARVVLAHFPTFPNFAPVLYFFSPGCSDGLYKVNHRMSPSRKGYEHEEDLFVGTPLAIRML
jgi:hypothetical protein